jgi:hypothetical protein
MTVGIFGQPAPPPVCADIAGLVKIAGAHCGISPERIVGELRDAKSVRARFAVAWAARELLGYGSGRIGSALGGREHKTIRCALARADGLIAAGDPAFITLCKTLLAGGGWQGEFLTSPAGDA